MLLAQFKKTALGKTLCGQAWLGRVGAIITVVLGAVSLWHQQYGAHLFMRIGTSDLCSAKAGAWALYKGYFIKKACLSKEGHAFLLVDLHWTQTFCSVIIFS